MEFFFTAVALGTIALCIWSLHLQSKERELWQEERTELINRIKNPTYIPPPKQTPKEKAEDLKALAEWRAEQTAFNQVGKIIE